MSDSITPTKGTVSDTSTIANSKIEDENTNTSKGFVVELWESIFTPGTSPALIKATHASFITLISVFCVLVFISKPPVRIHFINLLVLSVVFYLVVVWFIKELLAAQAAEAAVEASRKQK